jgi:phosphoserine aminotransferase
MSSAAIHRIYNFSAGPAVLPLPVLEEAQRDLIALPGVGMSVLEISHRSKPFDEIMAAAEADIRTLAGIPANYKILFLQGGASLQFSMVPMNLLPSGGTADYILTGDWGKKALKEARRVGATHVAGTTESGQFKDVPAQSALQITPGSATFTSRRTRPSTASSGPTCRTWVQHRSCAICRRTCTHGRLTSAAMASSMPARRRTSGHQA